MVATARLKVLDLINTSESAKELLLDRALDMRRRHGVETHLLCSSGPYVEVLREAGLTVHVVDTPRSLRPLALARSYTRLVRLLRRERYDILHSHGSVLGALNRLARPFTDALIVHSVHGFHFHEEMSPVRRLLYQWAERLLARISDVLLSQNREDLEVIEGWRTPARSGWIGNGIFLPEVDFEYRAERKSEYLLCSIARFEPVKNHRLLLDAFALLMPRGVEARLVCFGDGELLKEMRAYARDLGLWDRVAFPGYVDDVVEHLEGFDLHLLASVKEGLPRALIETMAVGIPSVATDVKGSREVVVHGVTGRLVPLGDPPAFADAVHKLLENPGLRGRLSRAGMRRARQEYDERAVCDRLAGFYRSIVEARRPERTLDGEICGKYSCSN